MLKFIIVSTLYFASLHLTAQAIDGSFAFDNDPEKKYSLYIPSTYSADKPNAMMVGLHPFNTSRWDGQAWRDTLIVFAEENNLVLVCPDGGLDGKIDDTIDTAFTSVLVDSVSSWYNIDETSKYMIGFSWGAKTTYTYGLRHSDEYSGYLIIGAAVDIFEVADVIDKANNETLYLVHGSRDSPGTRFTPLLDALKGVEACVESTLMDGIGHTIDFPNRNQILTDAYNWLVANQCQNSRIVNQQSNLVKIFPNPTTQEITIEGMDLQNKKIRITDLYGHSIEASVNFNKISMPRNYVGPLIITISDSHTVIVKRVLKI